MVGEDSEPEKNVFRIGGNTFYNQKNKIPIKTPEFKRSGIGLIAEFSGIPNRFPNQVALTLPLTQPDQLVSEKIVGAYSFAIE